MKCTTSQFCSIMQLHKNTFCTMGGYMQTKNERPAKTAARILEAAKQLTIQKGWHNTTVRDICNACNISVGAFYHHFSSKQELMNRAFLLFDETLAAELPLADGPPVEMLRRILLTQTSFVAREAGPVITEYYRNILTDEQRAAVDPQRLYYQRVLHYTKLAHAQGILNENFTPQQATELLIKFVRGSLIDWCLHNCDYDVTARTEQELDLLLGGLCKR